MTTPFQRHLAAIRGIAPPARVRPTRPSHLSEPKIRQVETDAPTADWLEADICDALGEWLRGEGWEVFFEVPLDSARPDVVAFRDDRTMAIEAKRTDVDGVIHQGLRIAHRVDSPWVALPLTTASEVVRKLTRIHERRPSLALPGVLAVGASLGAGTDVRVLAEPIGAPRRRLATDKLRFSAERYGAERGGVPNTDQTLRNVAVWADRAGGVTFAQLAERYRLSPTGVRSALGRVALLREHLRGCPQLPCLEARGRDKGLYALAHRHADALLALPDLAL